MLSGNKDLSENGEWFPVVDDDGLAIGKAPRSICHDGNSKLLHPVVHLHLLNGSGELFLQKRALTKDIEPGKWDTSVGGHVAIDEQVSTALQRETEEELGIVIPDPVFIMKYVWESVRERELVYSYYAVSDKCPVVNKDEIEQGSFWKIDEIVKNTGKGLFTPNFEQEFKKIFTILKEVRRG